METKDVINLYTTPNCPKCNILKTLCENSDYIKTSDFQICDITGENNTYADLLSEKGFNQVPVLLVNDTFYNFNDALTFIRSKS